MEKFTAEELYNYLLFSNRTLELENDIYIRALTPKNELDREIGRIREVNKFIVKAKGINGESNKEVDIRDIDSDDTIQYLYDAGVSLYGDLENVYKSIKKHKLVKDVLGDE